MNRVVILQTCPHRGSGAERVLEYLLQGSAARRDEICLLSPPSSSVTECARDLGFPWAPWRIGRDALWQNARAMLQIFAREGRYPLGNCVHSWHPRNFEFSVVMGRKWQIPCAGTLHDDPKPSHDQFGPTRRLLIRESAARMNGLVAVSQAVADRCKALGWQREATVIRNGLPDAPPSLPSFGSPLRLGFMGQAVAWKGIALLPSLVHKTRDLPLEWHVFGHQEGEVSPVVDELRSMSNVFLRGRVTPEEAFASMDILLHLSTAFDPYPTVLLEAARAGLPAIATATGGSPEIVRNGQTGLIVPSGDLAATETAVRRLAASPAERQDMGRVARNLFEKSFRVERMVADYFAFWDRLRRSRS